MPIHKNLGAYRGAEPPKGGVKISNSDLMHSSMHRNLMNSNNHKDTNPK